jgi:hypothetical protein
LTADVNVGGVVSTGRMTDLRQALAAADAGLRGAVETADLSRVTDAELLSSCREIEALARLLDGARVLHAAELAQRARSRDGLVASLGACGPVDAVARVSGISGAAAKQRIRTGSAIASGASAGGGIVPPRFPLLSAAVRSGRLSVESAGILVARLGAVPSSVDVAALRAAESGLVDAALGTTGRPALSVELLRTRAAAVVADLDHEGVRRTEERALARRSLRFGPEDADGLTPVHGALLPVVAARFQRLRDAHIKAARPSFHEGEAVSEVVDGGQPAGSAGARARESRSREQQRHDVLGAILDAASRVADAPHLAGSPPAVIVTVQRRVLDERRGAGFIDGLDTPVSIDTVEGTIDSAGLQTVTLSEEGSVLCLGSVQRCFTPSQRRAITARDGGCLIPGCPIPAGWYEVHHVIPYRLGGATHVDNGVLLCWWHHHIIDSAPWRLRMLRGVPQVRGPAVGDWTVATKRRTCVRGYDPPVSLGVDPPPSGWGGPP